jgi:LemA protein
MKRLGITLVVLLMAFGLYTWMAHNSLSLANDNVEQQWAQVDARYQREADLTSDLVSLMKDAIPDKNSVLTEVINAQAKVEKLHHAAPYDNPKQLAHYQQTQAHLDAAVNQLLALAKQYPDLTSDSQFLFIQNQLRGTEHRVALAQQQFNKAAKVFNTKIKHFPNNWIAMVFQFTPKAYFQLNAR